jgi:hypothetical protein
MRLTAPGNQTGGAMIDHGQPFIDTPDFRV